MLLEFFGKLYIEDRIVFLNNFRFVVLKFVLVAYNQLTVNLKFARFGAELNYHTYLIKLSNNCHI